MPTLPQQTFALIVGAGPIGLMLACQLKNLGVPAVIIEKKSQLSSTVKACMVSSRTLDLLDTLNLAERAIALGVKMRGVEMYDRGQCVLSGTYDEIPYRFPFNLHLGQPYIEQVFKEWLDAHDSPIFFEHELIDFQQTTQGVCASVKSLGQTHSIQCQWLIGCDGSNSFVRKHCDLEFSGETFPTKYFIGNVRLDWPLSRAYARVFYNDAGTLAVYALPDGMTQVVADLQHFAAAEKLRNPTLADLQQCFDERCPFAGQLTEPEWLSYYFAHARAVKNPIQGRILLAGDAAHVVSPLTGLGMNTGLQDAVNLSWKLQWIYQGWAHQSLINSYGQERAYAILRLHKLSRVLNQIFLQSDSSIGEIRNHLIQQTVSITQVRHKQINLLMQKSLSYPASTIIQSQLDANSAALPAGQLIPDALQPLLDSRYHSLIYFAADSAIPDEINSFPPHPGLKCYLLKHSAAPIANNSWQLLEDSEQQIHQQMQVDAPTLYLVRPDQYIALALQPARIEKIYQYFETLTQAK
jgi:2-polyprenyl-6-methoxyphenol hydroxylase-like FAD-dependent oxidoreductase